MNSPLHTTLEGNILLTRMDDGKANALSTAMIEALLEAATRAEKDAEAMVLTGRPDRFCAGFDLKVMMSGPEQASAHLKHGSALLMRLFGLSVPLVIACSGHALAGGALVVLTGDVRIAASGPYRMGLNEVQIGLPVPILAMELARARLHPAALDQATLMARIYTPDEALRAGYVDEVVAPDEVMGRAMAEAKRLSELPRRAYAATKQRLRGQAIEYVNRTLDIDVRELLAPAGA